MSYLADQSTPLIQRTAAADAALAYAEALIAQYRAIEEVRVGGDQPNSKLRTQAASANDRANRALMALHAACMVIGNQ